MLMVKKNPGNQKKSDKNIPAVRSSSKKTSEYPKSVQKLLLQSEERWRRSEQKYRSLVESIPDIIFALNLDGSFSYIGPQWKEILGHDESEVLGKYFINFAPDEYHPALIQEFVEARKGVKGTGNARWHFYRKNGELRYFSGFTAPMLDDQGRVVGTMGIARDITEQKKLEEQLLQAQKMESIGTLAGGIAHDFNNLLTGILAYASFVKKNFTDQEPLYHSVSYIERSAEQAAELTRQLLGFARRGKHQVKAFQCNKLIQALLKLLKRTIDKRITLEVELEPGLKWIEGDENQLHQSLFNICLNARDAMPSGGLLKIKTENRYISEKDGFIQQSVKEGQYVLISVIDTGMGMSPEIQAKIFEPFFTTKEPGRGTGLGMAMVYGIIQNHGGYIDIKSQEGQGTRLDLFLPALTEISGEEAATPPAKSRLTGGPETLLIIDDEEIIRQLGADILEDVGYKVLVAKNGEEGAEIFSRHKKKISLVILDVMMPGWSGRKTFLKLRKINPRIKILLSSGYSTEGEVKDILKEGVSGLIQKPYKDEELILKVRDVLDMKDDKG
jgi:two-component system, cell cycle sensor histidine kinase and response regulator CckA